MQRLRELVLTLIAVLIFGMGSAMAADLVVTSITWDPATDLQEGQDITLIAEIQNADTDSFAATFSVNFSVDAANLGDMNVTTTEFPLGPGATVTVAFDTTLYASDRVVTVTVDSGNAISEINEDNNTLSADLPAISDYNPPENISGLALTDSRKTSLTFAWSHSVNTIGDLAGYKLYFNGATEAELLPAAQSSMQKAGLSPASAYDIRITAYDHAGNESEGVSVTGYTVMENPVGLVAASRPAFVDLSWESPSPEAYVDHYVVYVGETDFLTIQGMTARKTSTDSTVTIGGMESGRTYYFAVVAVNLSGGVDEAVTTIAAPLMPGTAVSGNIAQNTTWSMDNSPYVVTGDITVRHSNYDYYTHTAPASVTLTIEPGVEVRFEPGTGLYIGSHYYGTRGYHGALSVQGTEAEPVLFTSNAASPQPGDWKGIVFRNATHDA
ncbi:fibronectin type III domain-containing protein, partial [Desulfosarcina sp.]|uniref:fibronectin type III domain-containing protein n=1 Tax=Desulfosarcina sp. TaxID=2027861 RepID=UPI0039707C31